jgi:hypothetical protein
MPLKRLTSRLRKNLRLQRVSLVGAPGFEPGTSSPPDFSALWREIRASGGKWLGYEKSETCRGSERHSSIPRFLGVWARSGPPATEESSQ